MTNNPNETPLTVADWRAWLAIPENRKRYEDALKEWDERLRPMIEANRRAQQITGDDLNIRVGPCRD